MITEAKRSRLALLHAEENLLNQELSQIDKAIRQLRKKKLKIAKRISHNMRFRNRLITEAAPQ
jgi:hypothetical protein